jgi:hypothetical protein
MQSQRKKKLTTFDLAVAWAKTFELIHTRLKELEIEDAHHIAAEAANILAKEGANGDAA